MKKYRVCILGSGLMSRSVIDFFCRNLDTDDRYKVTVGSNFNCQLLELHKIYPQISTVMFDVTVDAEMLAKIVRESDIVISLLTNDMQVPIAKVCIDEKVNMVHASYCTKEMKELDAKAKLNEVTILNELGLDPGIDHLLAMKLIDELHAEGSKVTGYLSFCGGLPEPKASHSNPLRYKFSWSPLTALRNLLNPAKYLKDNEVIEIQEGGCLIDAIDRSDDCFPSDMGLLEWYPNRDSLVYKELYGIEEASTVIRGTYRYEGFKEMVKALLKIGLLSKRTTTEYQDKKTWGELIETLICSDGCHFNSLKEHLFHHGYSATEICKVDELGLLTTADSLKLQPTLIETIAEYLMDKLKYEDMERDMIIMRHEVHYKKVTDSKQEVREIVFIAYGDEDKCGFSAMAKTVGLTIGYAAKLLLNGTINRPGIILPLTADIYNPILELLESDGFIFTENKYEL